MAEGVGVEWVQTSKPGLVSRAPEEFEGELRELRDEVRRLREQVAALATATARPSPVDERLPTFVGRLDPTLEGGVPKGSVIAVSGPGGSMKTSLALYILLKNRAAGRRGVYVTVEESRDSILRTMRHLGLGKEDDFLVDIAKLRIEREGVEEIRDWLRVLKDFLVRRRVRTPVQRRRGGEGPTALPLREDAAHEPLAGLLRPHVRQRLRRPTLRSPEAVPLGTLSRLAPRIRTRP